MGRKGAGGKLLGDETTLHLDPGGGYAVMHLSKFKLYTSKVCILLNVTQAVIFYAETKKSLWNRQPLLRVSLCLSLAGNLGQAT